MLNCFVHFSQQFNKIKYEIHPNHKFTLCEHLMYGIFVLVIILQLPFGVTFLLFPITYHILIRNTYVISLDFQKIFYICISDAGDCFAIFTLVVIFNCMSFYWNIHFSIFHFAHFVLCADEMKGNSRFKI